MGLMKRSRLVDRTGIYNDPTEAAKQQRITYHREGIQNAFPDQGALTSHLMSVEVVENEEAEVANAAVAPDPKSQGGRKCQNSVLILSFSIMSRKFPLSGTKN